jgi:hypothetical protein
METCIVLITIVKDYNMLAEIGILLLIRLHCSKRLIPAIGSIVASVFSLSAGCLLLPVINSRCHIEIDKPHIIA